MPIPTRERKKIRAGSVHCVLSVSVSCPRARLEIDECGKSSSGERNAASSVLSIEELLLIINGVSVDEVHGMIYMQRCGEEGCMQ